jgi:hypothetical protein
MGWRRHDVFNPVQMGQDGRRVIMIETTLIHQL